MPTTTKTKTAATRGSNGAGAKAPAARAARVAVAAETSPLDNPATVAVFDDVEVEGKDETQMAQTTEKTDSAPEEARHVSNTTDEVGKLLVDAIRAATPQPAPVQSGPASPLHGLNTSVPGGKYMYNNRWVSAEGYPIPPSQLSPEDKAAAQRAARLQAQAMNARYEPDTE